MKCNFINYTLLTAVASCFFMACTKLDDSTPSVIATDNFNPGSGEVSTITGAAYAPWRALYGGRPGLVEVEEITADEFIFPGRPNGWVDGGVYKNMHTHSWISTQPQLSTMWSKSYEGIANCNRIIYQIESGKLPIAVAAIRDQTIAELKMLRVSYYYVLNDLFGNIPVVTQFDVPAGYLPTQSKRADVVAFMLNEIQASLPFLSTTVSTSTYGRFTKYGAYALLAKIYLNSEVYTGTAKWNECMVACDSVINSGKYALAPSVRAAFTYNNESSKETIWAIPYDEKFAIGMGFYMWGTWDRQGATFNASGGPNAGGWGGCGMLPQFISTYNPTDDRLKNGFLFGQQYTSSGTSLVASWGTDNGKPYILRNTMPNIDRCEQLDGYQIYKYEYKNGIKSGGEFMSNDAPFLRYADVLMMKAECLLRTGNSAGAASLVTQVRARSITGAAAAVTGPQLISGSIYAYGVTDNTLPNTTEGGADISMGRFLDELGWEFNLEGRRRTDLIRFGVYSSKSWFAHQKTNNNNKKLFLIPQAEINKNPNLVQNPQ